MIRREARLRREYVYRKSLEEKQRLIDEKRQTVKKYVNENRPIPTHLRKDAIELQQDVEWGGENGIIHFSFQSIICFVIEIEQELNNMHSKITYEDELSSLMGEVSNIDDEYRYAGAADPKVVLTTSREPSAKLKIFLKEMRLMFPNAQRINRGHYDIKKLIQACKANDLTAILKHLFPVPKIDSRRIITFSNTQDFISFRHHTYSKDEHGEIKLKEIGPRFEMRPYLIKMGTIDNADAETTEWALRSYTNSARKRPALLSIPDDDE
ncbi:unnamed protein product [Onchocerca flexuosa]|uniref:Brix domain-containing protein n=1 Tax=Onchocerca flexuosa TaxID=387005 RepID=A0A183I3K4_9BILA|nr:unnamed protein product [Onchocerca flexuosa]